MTRPASRRAFGPLAVAFLAVAASPLPVVAQEALAGDAPAIRATIQGQLDAFRRDDPQAAYGFAAPNIRRMFPDADTFLSMVRRAYPPVYRPRQVEFSTLERRNGIVVQEVELVGPDGQPVMAAYTMEPGPGGSWRITGCALLPSVRVTA